MPPAPDKDWDLVEDLVFECLELAADDADGSGPRIAELLAGHEPAVAEEVRRVLADITGWQSTAPPRTGPSRLQIPATLGPYRIAERLGQGGMGAVYVGHDETLDRRVAVKVVRPELLAFDGARERFRREVEAVARLSHPGIVPVYQVGEDDGVPWFAMELLAGGSMADALARLRGRDPASLCGDDLRAQPGTDGDSSASGQLQGNWQQVCLRIAREVADALAHAHSRGVLHRDVKPSNIVLDENGHARVLDFGLARAEGGGELTASGAVLGSMPYLPPEHLEGNAGADDARTDVYALGVTLYEMLSLRSPFLGENEAVTMRLVEQGNPPPLRQLHRGLTWEVATVVGVAIDRDPQRRYQSMLDFSADLQRALDRRPIAARPPSSWLRMRRSIERNPITATGIVAAVVATIALALVYTLGLQAERDAAIDARRETQRLREVDRVRGYRASVAAAHMAIQLGQSGAAHAQLQSCPEELREYEWRHLMARLDQDLEAIAISDKFLRGVVPTRRGLVTAGADGSVHLVAPTPDRTVTTFEPAGLPLIMAVAASDDGHHVLTGHMDHSVGLWDGVRGQLRARISLDDLYDREIDRLQQRCFAVAVSADGGTGYAVGCGGAVAVLDLATGEIRSSFLLPPVRGAIFSIAIDDAGERLAVGHGHDVIVVRPDSGELLHLLRGHFGYVHALRFTADGSYLLSAGQDRTARVWNVTNGRTGQVLFGHDGAVFDLAVGADGTVWTASGDATLRQWDIRSGRERRRLGADTALYAIATIGDQLVTAGWDGHLRTWDATADRAHRHVDDNRPTQLAKLVVHDDGARCTVVDVDNGVRTFALPDGEPVEPLVPGKPAAIAVHGDVVAAVRDGTLVEFGDRTLTGAERALERLCVLADGTVVAAESEGDLLLWPTDSDRGRRVAAHTKPVWVLERFRGGFVSAAEDGLVLHWRDGQLRELLRRDVEWQGAQASRDERMLYLAGLGKLLALDVESGVVRWERDVAERMRDVAISASGNRLLVVGADRFLHIVDASDGYEILGLPTDDPMRCIANVADATVTVSVYSAVDIWFGR